MKSQLVFCANCKYYRYRTTSIYDSHSTVGSPHKCYYKDNFEFEYLAIGEALILKDRAITLNANNDCKWYKRKWYKFGAKK